SIFDEQVLPLHITEVAQTLTKCIRTQAAKANRQVSDTRQRPCLSCPRREWQRCRRAARRTRAVSLRIPPVLPSGRTAHLDCAADLLPCRIASRAVAAMGH